MKENIQVYITDYAKEDIIKLSDNLKKECLHSLYQLEKGKIRGQSMGIIDGMDLSYYNELNFNNGRYKIIYSKGYQDQMKEIYVEYVSEINTLKAYKSIYELPD